MKTAHIIKFGHYSYAAESMAVAVKAIEVLSKLQRVEFHYDHDTERGLREAHYFPTEDKAELKLEMHQPYRPKIKPMALPRPKRGTRRCICGHSDVSPKESCPSCGADYLASC